MCQPTWYGIILALAILGTLTGDGQADEAVNIIAKDSGENTGTMHYSKSVEFRMGDGFPAVIKSNVESGGDVIAPCGQFLTKRMGKQLVAAFGWSSWGGGTENYHVILLRHTSKGTQITDQLLMTVRRGAGGFIWSDKNRLSVLKPAEFGHVADSDPFLVSSFGKVTYGQIRHLNFVPVSNTGTWIHFDSGIYSMTATPLSDGSPPFYRTLGTMVTIEIVNGRFDLKSAIPGGK